jgi:hypothetical protein
MGEPFRAAGSSGDLIGQWFTGADANRDRVLTQEEMKSDAARFFRTLDANRDGQITPPEMIRYEAEIAPEISLGGQLGPRPGGRRGNFEGRAEGFPMGGAADERQALPREGGKGLPILPQGASRYGLLDLPQPVAGADADFDRAVTAAEFEDAASVRFALLDRDHDGRITRQELEPLPPPVKKK